MLTLLSQRLDVRLPRRRRGVGPRRLPSSRCAPSRSRRCSCPCGHAGGVDADQIVGRSWSRRARRRLVRSTRGSTPERTSLHVARGRAPRRLPRRLGHEFSCARRPPSRADELVDRARGARGRARPWRRGSCAPASIPPSALVSCGLIRRTSSIAPSARSTSARSAAASSPSTPPRPSARGPGPASRRPPAPAAPSSGS